MAAIDSLIALAHREVGTREIGGNNRGKRVVEYQRATWLEPSPWPWCAAFTCWLLREWIKDPAVRKALYLRDEAHAERWRCQDASAFGWEKWARKKNLTVLPDTERAMAGDFVVFDFSHIGIVAENQHRGGAGVIQTIEGNTNGRGDRDSTSGDGVWRKERKWSLAKSFIRIPV